jgi:hypothetical protein
MFVQRTNRFWTVSLDLKFSFDFVELFSGDEPRNKLRGNTNFIFFGPTNQKLWVFEVLRRSLGRAGMYSSQ